MTIKVNTQYEDKIFTIADYCNAQSLDPQLTLSTYSTTLKRRGSTTVTVSYLGTGTISVESIYCTINAYYDSSSKVISLQATEEPADDYNDTIIVSLSASPGYTSATATITNSDTSVT